MYIWADILSAEEVSFLEGLDAVAGFTVNLLPTLLLWMGYDLGLNSVEPSDRFPVQSCSTTRRCEDGVGAQFGITGHRGTSIRTCRSVGHPPQRNVFKEDQ